jgi:hypothetical protein
MKYNPMPYKIKNYFKGNILLKNPELFANAIGFYNVKLTTPDSIMHPIFPYRSQSGLVIYPIGTWGGMYFSEEIKNAKLIIYSRDK